jgi:hypothetical protein
MRASLNWFLLDVDAEDSKWKGTFVYEYLDPKIHLKAKF